MDLNRLKQALHLPPAILKHLNLNFHHILFLFRVLYTFNRGDFYRLHTQYLTEGKYHRGIILAPQQRYSIGEQLRQILELISGKTSEVMENNVEFIKG